MNKLYVELRGNNPDWDTDKRREELNHFFARLIFCFFAEDTGIFPQDDLFTGTVQQMSESDGSNTHEVIGEIFRAMNIPRDERDEADLPPYAANMPYVNGGLFEGSTDCPTFTKIARSYLIHIGGLDWTKINPDIFGSMIQAVAEDEERGELGMHYTSVPNILKVLNPLFLDELRQQLEDADDNKRKLLNLRNRMARIRVFDPACGSGNFLVVAYKEMRKIEAEINRRRAEADRASEIPLTNFRGIEIRSFAAEVARLALVIAQFQCDLEYRGRQLALSEALPLSKLNWITCGNALRLNWTQLCPVLGKTTERTSTTLLETDQDAEGVGFKNSGSEVFICGNPPYTGSRRQSDSQKEDLKAIASQRIKKWKSLDYVAGWIFLACDYCKSNKCSFAFVSTSSVCEGLQASLIWTQLAKLHLELQFAVTPFRWSNLAKENAGVTVVIAGVGPTGTERRKRIYSVNRYREVRSINGYLTAGDLVPVETAPQPIFAKHSMMMGSMPRDGGHLIYDFQEARHAQASDLHSRFLNRYLGTNEMVKGAIRYTLWINDDELEDAASIPAIRERLRMVEEFRRSSKLDSTLAMAKSPHRFVYLAGNSEAKTIVIGRVSSERREYLPVDIVPANFVVSDSAFAMYDAPIWTAGIILSKLHRAWVFAVCGRLDSRIRYSNTLGWNTFPLPPLAGSARIELEQSTNLILVARESYWPATIADMYEPDRMDTEFPRLREAHDHNDEVLERIYIGRRFKNDTERLEKLFEMYATATEKEASA